MSVATPTTDAFSAPAPSLPTPTDRPSAAIVVYDGHCRFCRGSVQRLSRFDLRNELAYLSLHDPEVARRWPDLRHDDLMRNMLVVDPRGGKHWGAAGFRYLLRHMPTLWLLAPLLHIPYSLPVWQRLYQMVARRRYVFGRVESCDDGSCSIRR